MARLPKSRLLHVVENAIRESGWNFLYLTSQGTHPARYQIYRNGSIYRIRVYIWNLTPGGRNRPADEWRIQVTGLARFEPEPGGKTLILGWRDTVGVFAGFDYTRHDGPLGASPSIQLREAALRDAVVDGFAPHNKGNRELAIAFRPDFLGAYIENLESLHECGQADQEIGVLQRIGKEAQQVRDGEIAKVIAPKRRYAVVSTKRALREINFRDRVLTAYGHRCAMCGVQLRLLDAAHILPVACPGSTDGTDNGVALCTLHHRAYDRAFVAFGPDFRIHVNRAMAEELVVAHRGDGLDQFTHFLRPILILPPARKDRPSARFVMAANRLRGWP